MNISSSSYYSVGASTTKGFAGLASGIDTDSMVKEMLSGTQAKIDKQNQLKQQIQWKQEIYHDVISTINGFYSKYFDSAFDSTLKTNLYSASFYDSMVSKIKSGDALNIVSTSSSAIAGDVSIVVKQLASAATLVGDNNVSSSKKISSAALSDENLSSVFANGASVSFDLSLDGITKTITLSDVADNDGNITLESVRDAMEKQIQKAFGSYLKVEISGSGEERHLVIDLNIDQPGHELKIIGADALKLGFTPGDSNLIGYNTKLGDLGALGQRFSFTINGTHFSFDKNDTIGSMINKINNSDVGVNISYSTLSDTFRIEAASSGAYYGIDITQHEGNLLGILLGEGKISSGSAVASGRLTTGTVAGNPGGLAGGYTTTDAALVMNVNGKSYTFNLPKLPEGETYDKVAIEEAFDKWLLEKFGKTGDVQNIKYENGNLTVASGFEVSFDKTAVNLNDADAVATASEKDLALAFGFSKTGASNIATDDTPVSEIVQLQGLTILDSDGNPAERLSDIATINGYSVTYSDSRLVLAGSGTFDLSGEPGLSALFGASSFTLSDGSLGSGAVKEGTDAIIGFNGTEVYRSSNTFTIEGLTLELSKTSKEILDEFGAVVGYEETVISTSRDLDKIVETMRNFVNDYNAMLDKLNGYLDEESTYREYLPLTETQKKEMTEREIELWEKKAKQGLVRNDPYISGFLSQLRTILYTKPEGGNVGLYNIGIETMSWQNKGKLEFNETTFRNALATNAADIKKLFTDSKEGLAVQITKAVNETARLSVASPGTLVALAGAQGWKGNEKNNTLFYQLQSVESRLKELNNRYEKERARYWRQFNDMEKIISYYSMQSSMISQTFMGY
ncbi:MAG TPA: flagellar filament capping protein FliD [Clostridiales bacterium]|nr:flagellar filament capping protein FliD [Clostridiales bacterium]